MASTFGWLDQDDAQRAAMNEVVKLFQDKSSVDELGIGPIRDAFSNSFFPGTSVLHTRIRYLLFVPWLLLESTRKGQPIDAARIELKSHEVRLIKALLKGGMTSGVIGSQAQERLLTMPSQVYWPALQRLGLIGWDSSIDAHLRRAGQAARRGRDVTEGDVDEAGGPDLGVHRDIPAPPRDLLKTATFDLRADEADFLQSMLVRLPGGSLLSWLAARPRGASGAWPWEMPAVADLPETLSASVEHARRLHHAWHGAPLLYNLMLAELTRRDDLVSVFDEALADWESELSDHRVFEAWSRPTFWSHVRALNPRLRTSTQDFVERWCGVAERGEHRGEAARRLIIERELRLKGRRARLHHAQARETWSPGAGTGRLGYRWGIARSYLTDLHEGLTRDDASTEEIL
ncbi:DUF6361 family protein [Nocardioides plantarum]|uniref:DUF6361 family protein n=1 Tax=Nocardioides plantarum TaxID=29299 RepID=A0ABV5KEF5_9ACTN|nr:DUF6361 family protein [Nocardioides plantarum]